MRLFIALFLFTGVTGSALAQVTKAGYLKKLNGIDKELNKVLQDQRAVGFSVAVVYKDHVLMSKGFGYKDLETKDPVTPNTLFAIGSSTKAFTSSILGKLEAENKLKLDDPASMHLPQLRFKDDVLTASITIKDMMCHRTGFQRYDYSWYFFNSSSRDSLIQRVQHMEPTYGLREKWQYNNWMFLAQGMIAEKITNKSWEENIDEMFFKPLKMIHSTTDFTKFTQNEDVAQPYVFDRDYKPKKVPFYHINGMGPAGSINSSASDMANWVSTWIMGGKFQGQEIIPTSYLKRAIRSQMIMGNEIPSDDTDSPFSSYGFGWMISSYRGHYLVEHGGNIDGFTANVAFFPNDSIGIVVLVNQNGSEVPEIVQNIIADKLFGLSPKPWNEDAKKNLEKRILSATLSSKTTDTLQIKGTTPTHPLSDYSGFYSNPAYGNFQIVLENNKLVSKLAGEAVWFCHYHYNVFAVLPMDVEKLEDADSKLLVRFEMDDYGKIDQVSFQLGDPTGRTVFTRSTAPVNLDMSDLQRYVGEYDLSGQTVKTYLRGDILIVLVPGQPEYETVAVGDHAFELAVARNYKVQFKLELGEVVSMTFIQPNGNFVAKRKK